MTSQNTGNITHTSITTGLIQVQCTHKEQGDYSAITYTITTNHTRKGQGDYITVTYTITTDITLQLLVQLQQLSDNVMYIYYINIAIHTQCGDQSSLPG